MYLQFGNPPSLSEIDFPADIDRLKSEIPIAIIDDLPFQRTGDLRTNGFNVTELGADIKSIKQLEAYPVIVCDIRGVAPSFGSEHEGAHLISETRKSYPDKYIIAYTASGYDASLNEKVSSADRTLNKDIPYDFWHKEIEHAIKEIGNPKSRWLRFRKHLIESGIDAWKIFNIEQVIIKSIKSGDATSINKTKITIGMTPQESQLITTLASIIIPSIIKILYNQGP